MGGPRKWLLSRSRTHSKHRRLKATITTGTENSFGAGVRAFRVGRRYYRKGKDELAGGTSAVKPLPLLVGLFFGVDPESSRR